MECVSSLWQQRRRKEGTFGSCSGGSISPKSAEAPIRADGSRGLVRLVFFYHAIRTLHAFQIHAHAGWEKNNSSGFASFWFCETMVGGVANRLSSS